MRTVENGRPDNHTDLLGFDQALISKTSEEISNFPCFLFSPLFAPALPLLPASFPLLFFLLCLLSCFPSLSLHLSQNKPSPEKSSSSFLSKTQNITPLLQQHSLTVPLQKPPTILCLPLLSEIFLLPKTPKNPPPRSVSPSYCPTIPLSLTASLSPKLPQSADMLPL